MFSLHDFEKWIKGWFFCFPSAASKTAAVQPQMPSSSRFISPCKKTQCSSSSLTVVLGCGTRPPKHHTTNQTMDTLLIIWFHLKTNIQQRINRGIDTTLFYFRRDLAALFSWGKRRVVWHQITIIISAVLHTETTRNWRQTKEKMLPGSLTEMSSSFISPLKLCTFLPWRKLALCREPAWPPNVCEKVSFFIAAKQW